MAWFHINFVFLEHTIRQTTHIVPVCSHEALASICMYGSLNRLISFIANISYFKNEIL